MEVADTLPHCFVPKTSVACGKTTIPRCDQSKSVHGLIGSLAGSLVYEVSSSCFEDCTDTQLLLAAACYMLHFASHIVFCSCSCLGSSQLFLLLLSQSVGPALTSTHSVALSPEPYAANL